MRLANGPARKMKRSAKLKANPYLTQEHDSFTRSDAFKVGTKTVMAKICVLSVFCAQGVVIPSPLCSGVNRGEGCTEPFATQLKQEALLKRIACLQGIFHFGSNDFTDYSAT